MKTVTPVMLALCLATSVAAQERIADDRRVEVFSSNGNSMSSPTSPFEDFLVTGQSSFFTADGFNGSISGVGDSDFDFFIRQSYFDTTFSVPDGTTLTLNGSAAGSAGDFGLATGRVRMYAGDQVDAEQLVLEWALNAESIGFDEDDFSFIEPLAAGTYRLVLQTDITPGGFGTSMDMTFDAEFDVFIDSDGDGVEDALDNCTLVANASQSDGDNDGYGNACDADLTNDCVVNVQDLGLMRLVFFTADPVVDLNDDGIVNVIDLGALRAAFFAAPGPSGLTDVCLP